MPTRHPIVTGIQCPSCKTIIISGSRHDYHSCPCGEVSIDGGREYFRCGFSKMAPTSLQIECIGFQFKDLSTDASCHSDIKWANRQLPKNKTLIRVPPRKLTVIKTSAAVNPNRYRYTLNAKGKFYRYPQPFPMDHYKPNEPLFKNMGENI